MGKINVKIDRQGNIQMEVDGVVGTGCDLLTKPLEQALGITTDVERKPEYYQELEGMEQKIFEGDE